MHTGGCACLESPEMNSYLFKACGKISCGEGGIRPAFVAHISHMDNAFEICSRCDDDLFHIVPCAKGCDNTCYCAVLSQYLCYLSLLYVQIILILAYLFIYSWYFTLSA